jgi:hypothetical protein
MEKYKHKYFKYKNKYTNLVKKSLSKKDNIYTGGDNIILYENIVGSENPKENIITETSISDHYLLYKELEIEENPIQNKKLHLFNINIAQQYKFSSKIAMKLFFNTMRNEEHLEFMYANRNKILDFIINFSNENYNELKEYFELKESGSISKIKNSQFAILKKVKNKVKELSLLSKPSDYKDISIKIIKINKDEAKEHIKNSLLLDESNDSYYTFDIEYDKESIEDYRMRIEEFLKIMGEQIKIKNVAQDDYLVINIQELNPLDKIIDLFEGFVHEMKEVGIEIKLIINEELDKGETFSISIVSTNTEYYLDKSEQNDSIMKYILETKSNNNVKNFKISSRNSLLPPIYNFHTGLFVPDGIIELVKSASDINQFIIFGDLNLRMIETDEICMIKDFSKLNNMVLELTATPESHFKENNYTYDVLLYKLE